MTPSPESPIRINLLGSFEVAREARVLPAEVWPRKKAAILLGRLTFERRLIKDQVIDSLWPESDAISGANNLYRTLYSLRQILDTHLGEGAADAIFSFEDGVLRLIDSVWVDVHEFQRLLAAPPDEPAHKRSERMKQALALYRGDLLPDERYTDWLQQPREELLRQKREVSLQLAGILRDELKFEEAVRLITPLLTHDPADEAAHRELMRAFCLAGRRHEALRQYQILVNTLAAELDVPPEPETSALYAQILRGELSQQRVPTTPFAWTPPAASFPEAMFNFPLVGRAEPLKTITNLIDEAREGRGRTILVAGESGVGKSRLAIEILRSAGAAGITTLVGRAYEREGRLPYQPFLEAFDRYLVEQGRPPDENPILNFRKTGAGDLQQAHWSLYQSTARFLIQIAEQSPVVFLLDDLHAADEAALQLFHYLVRQTRTSPVILMSTYRSETLVSAITPFSTLLNSLYREGLSETIDLAPLSPSEVPVLVEQIAGGAVAPQLAQAIYDVSAGSPFFTQEMTSTLVKAGQLELKDGLWALKPGVELKIPPSLSSLLREQVFRLGQSVETTLTAASVVGMEFRFDVLRSVAPLADGEILDAIDLAFANRLLEETPNGYRFHHPLIRRTLYESLTRVRRAHLHTRTAEAIEANSVLRPSGLQPQIEALAFHYDLSDRRDRALEYLIQAGERAGSVFAFEVAVQHFKGALALMEELGLADPARRCKLLETLGGWEAILADTPSAVYYFEQALALAAKEDWSPNSSDLVRLHSGAAVTLITAGETDAAEQHLNMALSEVAEGEETPEYIDLLYHLALLHWHRNEFQLSLQTAQRSLVIAERQNNTQAVARAYEMLALAYHSLGEWQSGIAYEEKRALLVGPWLDVTDAFDVHL